MGSRCTRLVAPRVSEVILYIIAYTATALGNMLSIGIHRVYGMSRLQLVATGEELSDAERVYNTMASDPTLQQSRLKTRLDVLDHFSESYFERG